MFIHLTNFSLNKESDSYKPPAEDFFTDDSGSKRLLTTAWKTLAADGKDVEENKEKIKDTLRKPIITMEPYLKNTYHMRINTDHENSRCF